MLKQGFQNFKQKMPLFDLHRAVHRNIISIVKSFGCTNVSNLFYFGMTLHMFRKVFPSIIRIQDCTYSTCLSAVLMHIVPPGFV